MAKVKSSKDLLMILLYAKGCKGKPCEPIYGRTRLMKMIFLFDKEIRKKFNLHNVISPEALPNFTPYDFGPFSAQVFSDLEFLIELGFVKVTQVGSNLLPEETQEYEYWQADRSLNEEDSPLAEEAFMLTSIGKEFVEEGEVGNLTDQQWVIMDEFKARCTAASLRALLRYVYTKYPEMTTESKIRDEILTQYKL